MDYFKEYMIVGGMPQAVEMYADTRDFEKVDKIKRNILRKQAENELLSILKEDIQGEIDAIELYTEHINKVHNPEIKARLIEIRTDEEEHLKELKDLVHKWFH